MTYNLSLRHPFQHWHKHKIAEILFGEIALACADNAEHPLVNLAHGYNHHAADFELQQQFFGNCRGACSHKNLIERAVGGFALEAVAVEKVGAVAHRWQHLLHFLVKFALTLNSINFKLYLTSIN